MATPKVWFITGASRGLSLEIAKAALERGDKVVGAARKVDALAAELRGDNVLAVALDVTDEVAAQATAQEATDHSGRIDILVNNAGYGILSAVEEASDAEIKQNYEANVFGLLNVTRAVLPFMRQVRKSHVMNLSLVGGLTGTVGWGLYGSTKFAVEDITEAMAQELAPLSIFAASVEPGFFRTKFLDESSLTRTGNVIEDYAATVGNMRDYAMRGSCCKRILLAN